ncbi:hypothetical protein BKA70DRAFT_1226447 [Coprinopsis sp. MPI-PUGE-AT-0042]|nr:hypothetical protein BKA70DRAFT_1226447 [Coprinopsis sp. MPI-PUGE-AT-0042]
MHERQLEGAVMAARDSGMPDSVPTNVWFITCPSRPRPWHQNHVLFVRVAVLEVELREIWKQLVSSGRMKPTKESLGRQRLVPGFPRFESLEHPGKDPLAEAHLRQLLPIPFSLSRRPCTITTWGTMALPHLVSVARMVPRARCAWHQMEARRRVQEPQQHDSRLFVPAPYHQRKPLQDRWRRSPSRLAVKLTSSSHVKVKLWRGCGKSARGFGYALFGISSAPALEDQEVSKIAMPFVLGSTTRMFDRGERGWRWRAHGRIKSRRSFGRMLRDGHPPTVITVLEFHVPDHGVVALSTTRVTNPIVLSELRKCLICYREVEPLPDRGQRRWQQRWLLSGSYHLDLIPDILTVSIGVNTTLNVPGAKEADMVPGSLKAKDDERQARDEWPATTHLSKIDEESHTPMVLQPGCGSLPHLGEKR